MYIFGGRDGENKKLNDLWKYDILKQEWKEISMTNFDDDPTWCVPLERSGHSCDIYGQYMVIFGGFYDLTKELNDLYLFDFVTERWIPIFMEENSPAVKSTQPYNDYNQNVTSMNLGSGVGSSLAFNKPIQSTTVDNHTVHSTTFEQLPNMSDPYNINKPIMSNRNRLNTANSSRRSSRIKTSFLRSSSKKQQDMGSKSILTVSTRKLSSEQSRFQIAKRMAQNSEFGRLNSSRMLDTYRGVDLCCSQGYGIQLVREASESSLLIKQ